MSKKPSTFMKRRKIAIIISAVAVVVLAVALVFVMEMVNSVRVEDPADGSIYYIREKDDVYALYDTDKKTVMPTEGEYGYYVTHAGTLIEIDAETGEYEIIAVVDTEGNEVVGYGQRVLMFPHMEREDALQLDVYNSEGSFTFVRMNTDTGKIDSSAELVIKDSPLTAYDQEKVAAMFVRAGYVLTTDKIIDPIKDENGEFSEYGLVPERRTREVTDENGEFVLDEQGGYIYEEYDYVPAYYVLTDKKGNKHKVIIGDKLVTGTGYYMQYVEVNGEEEVKRDAVYVRETDNIEETLLAPIEELVTPSVTYPMTMNDYLLVKNFILSKKDASAEGGYDPVVGFDYIDMSERENTIKVHTPYEFHKDFALGGYTASSDNISESLRMLYQPSFVGVRKLSPSEKDLFEYGLAAEDGVDADGNVKYKITPAYIVSYDFDIRDNSGSITDTVKNMIYISAPNEAGNYYVYTDIYEVDSAGKAKDILYSLDMIVEVAGHSLEFLNWDSYDWINANYFELNIAHCEKITITDHATGYHAEFDLDNTATDMSSGVDSTDLVVHAKDSNGNDKTTFTKLQVTDESGNVWVITATDIKCYSPSGKEISISTAYYDYNSMGQQTKVVSGVISCNDGRRVAVTADTVEIRGAQTTKLVRYDTNLFRSFYHTLLVADIADSYVMTEAEEQQVTADENLLVTLTVLDTEGNERVYRFYYLTSRKAYITIGENGGFYVLSNRVEKFVSDAQRFFANENIDSKAKH